MEIHRIVFNRQNIIKVMDTIGRLEILQLKQFVKTEQN